MSTEWGIRLSPEDRATLERWVADRDSPQKWVWRARILLMWADGNGVTAIVREPAKPSEPPIAGVIVTLRAGLRGGSGMPASRASSAAFGRGDQACGGYDAASEAAGEHPLVGAQARQGGGAARRACSVSWQRTGRSRI